MSSNQISATFIIITSISCSKFSIWRGGYRDHLKLNTEKPSFYGYHRTQQQTIAQLKVRRLICLLPLPEECFQKQHERTSRSLRETWRRKQRSFESAWNGNPVKIVQEKHLGKWRRTAFENNYCRWSKMERKGIFAKGLLYSVAAPRRDIVEKWNELTRVYSKDSVLGTCAHRQISFSLRPKL